MLVFSSQIVKEGFDKACIHVRMLFLALDGFRHQCQKNDVVETHSSCTIRLSEPACVDRLEFRIEILSVENRHQFMDLTKKWLDRSVQNKFRRQDER